MFERICYTYSGSLPSETPFSGDLICNKTRPGFVLAISLHATKGIYVEPGIRSNISSITVNVTGKLSMSKGIIGTLCNPGGYSNTVWDKTQSVRGSDAADYVMPAKVPSIFMSRHSIVDE